MRRMRETGADARVARRPRTSAREIWEHRFPTILATCRAHGVDPVTELIPVAPAATTRPAASRTDLRGRTVPGLYACGEVRLHRACTARTGSPPTRCSKAWCSPADRRRPRRRAAARGREPVRRRPPAGPASTRRRAARCSAAMTEGAGVLRSARASLATTDAVLAALGREPSDRPAHRDAWEATNLHTVASVLVATPPAREETRGSHWREDFPDRDDEHWRGRPVVDPRRDGARREPVPTPSRRPRRSREGSPAMHAAEPRPDRVCTCLRHRRRRRARRRACVGTQRR